MRNATAVAVLLSAVLAAAAATPPAAVRGGGPKGVSAQIPGGGPPDRQGVERIVSVVPAATETLFALGAGDRVVGVGSYDTWPPRVRELPEVGGYVDPNYERIVSLRPDLAVLDAGQSAMARQLERAGIATFAFPHGDLEVALETMARLGEAVGMAAEGRALVERVSRRLDELASRYRSADRPRVLLVFGRGGGFRNVWVVGGTGFLDRLLEIAGADNVFADVAHDSFKAGLETLLARRPDVVLEMVPVADGEPLAREKIRAEWRSLPGFGEVRVAVLAEDHVGRPGPRMPETVALMARAIHDADRVDSWRSSDRRRPRWSRR